MNKKKNFGHIDRALIYRDVPVRRYARRLWDNQSVALLGGSFNPAHDGHFHIAKLALRRLRVNHVWWAVSPQNPLKTTKDMAVFQRRIASAQNQAQHPKMHVTDIESQMGTRYTVRSIRMLKKYFPKTRFIWVMGEDNLATIERWQEWRSLFRMVHVAIFHRKLFNQNYLFLKPLRKIARHILPSRQACLLKRIEGRKKCVMLYSRLNYTSSTALRKNGVRA